MQDSSHSQFSAVQSREHDPSDLLYLSYLSATLTRDGVLSVKDKEIEDNLVSVHMTKRLYKNLQSTRNQHATHYLGSLIRCRKLFRLVTHILKLAVMLGKVRL